MTVNLVDLLTLAGKIQDNLEKAKHTASSLDDFFSLRSRMQLSDSERTLVCLGYKGAAIEHDIVDDYLSQLDSDVNELYRNLNLLFDEIHAEKRQNDDKPGDTQDEDPAAGHRS